MLRTDEYVNLQNTSKTSQPLPIITNQTDYSLTFETLVYIHYKFTFTLR